MDDRGDEKTHSNLMAKKEEWFGEWFNSPFYHILYKKRDFKEAEQFISNLSQHLQIPPSSKVLDLACGKGRHAIYLNKLGFNVTGLDLSSESIQHAKRFENEHLQFKVHDMREPIEGNKFDFILNLFTSFGYFESDIENQQSINAMSHALEKNGMLVIDFMNAEKVIQNLIQKETIIEEGITFHISKEVMNGYILKHIQFEYNNQHRPPPEKVQALTERDFTKYLNFAGLSIKDKFGDYQLNSFDIKNSDRLILIATKS